MSIKNISNCSINFEYTKKVLLNKEDCLSLKITKLALIIFTLGTIFLLTAAIDLTISIYKWGSATKIKPKIDVTSSEIIWSSNRFISGWKKGFSLVLEIPKTTSRIFTINDLNTNPLHTYLAGYILSTIAPLAIIGGRKALTACITMHLLVLGFTSLKERTLMQLKPFLNQYASTKKIANISIALLSQNPVLLFKEVIDSTISIFKFFHKPEPQKNLKTSDKIILCAKRFYCGLKEGFSLLSDIPKTTSKIFNINIHNKKIVHIYLAGYILSTTYALWVICGNRGFLSGISIHLLGISYKPLTEKILIPLKQRSLPHNIKLKQKYFLQ